MKVPFSTFKYMHDDLKPQMCEKFSEMYDKGWFISGNECKMFEKEFSQYLGVKYCIVVVRVSRTPIMGRVRQAWVVGKALTRCMSSVLWNRRCVGMPWSPIIRALASRNGRSVGVCRCCVT